MALPMPKKNSVKTTIAAPGIDADDTTIPVAELSVFYDKDGALITEGICIGFLNNDDTLPEEITITGASGTSGAGNLTGATRGVDADGSIGAGHAWDAGTEIAVMFTTGVYLDLRGAIGDWAAFDLNPVWPGATPTITSTVARFVRNGNVVNFAITINISDGHDAVLDSISLPVAATQIAGHQMPSSSFKLYSDGVDDVVSDPYAYVDYNEATPVIKLRAGGSFPTGCTAVLNIAGSYEVPS